ncbi:MAG: alpha/beta hydrolase family protein [Promethearchaeota archaeon]
MKLDEFVETHRSTLFKTLFIGSIICISMGIASIIYFNYIYADSYYYEVHYEINRDVDGLPMSYTIDGFVYEPKHGILSNSSSEYRGLCVLVHGFAMSKEFMRSISLELARRGITTISISMPGHGFSDPPFMFANISPYAAIGAVDFMLNQNTNLHYKINESQIGIIGHSMGAMTAIKAGFLDSRFQYTVAMAAPSGESNLLQNGEQFKVTLGGSMRQWVNLTMPKNLFFVLGAMDEAVYPIDAEVIMENATGIKNIQPGILYNENFISGTSRKYNLYPLMDHATEVYDPRSVGDVIDWVALSLGYNPEEFSGNLNVFGAIIRPLMALIGVIGSLVLYMPLSIYLRNIFIDIDSLKEIVKTESENLKEINFGKKNIIFAICSFITFGGIIPTLIGNILPNYWYIGGSIVADTVVPILLISGICLLFLLLIFNLIGNKDNDKGKDKGKDKDKAECKLTNAFKLEDLARIPNIRKEFASNKILKNKYVCFLAYTSLSYIPGVLLAVLIWSIGLFTLFIPPFKSLSFALCYLSLIPFCIGYTFIIRKPLYLYLRNKLKLWWSRILTPILSAIVASLTTSLAVTFTIGSPLTLDPLTTFGFWFLILFMMFLVSEIIWSCWAEYISKDLVGQIIMPIVLFCLVIHVFPVSAPI